MGGYTLTDRGTWISFNNRGPLKILVEGDPRLFNQYGVIPVNPQRCPSVKKDKAREFMNWLLSEKGQEIIGSYRLRGQQLFHPNAKRSD
jgi:tungstate transport system substrate-binding protein